MVQTFQTGILLITIAFLREEHVEMNEYKITFLWNAAVSITMIGKQRF